MGEPTTTPRIETLLSHVAWLRRLAASLAADAARADDVVQQTLLAAIERAPEKVERPRAWLAKVALHFARRANLAEERRERRERVAAANESLPATDEVVADAALQYEIAGAVLALEEPYRTAILLRFFEDLKPRTIAKRTSSPVETVRTRVQRGVELVRAELIRRREGASRRGEWAVGLVGLLSSWERQALRRAIVAKGTGASAAIGSASVAGIWGAIAMSAKTKVAIAAIAVACATFVVVKLSETTSTPKDADAANAIAAPAPPVIVATTPTPAPADASPVPGPLAVRASEPIVAESPDVATTLCAIEGRVLTSRGDPAAGALVLLQVVEHGQSQIGSVTSICEGISRLVNGEPRDPTRQLRGETAADGSFRFEELQPAAHVDVAAIHDTEGVAVANGIVLAITKPRVTLELRLPESVVILGCVRDRSGQPIAGANIMMMGGWTGSGSTRGGGSLDDLKSDADGSYRTRALPFDQYSMCCYLEGYVQQQRGPFTVAKSEREHREDFTLDRAESLSGRVVRIDGTPARLEDVEARLSVWATEIDPRDWKDGPSNQMGGGRLNGDGYEVTLLFGTEKYVSLWGANALLGWAEIEEPGVGPELRVDLGLIPASKATASLTIEAIDAETGAAISGFDVRLYRHGLRVYESRARRARVSSTLNRRMTIPELQPGVYEAEVRAPGRLPRLVVANVTADPTSPPLRVELQNESVASSFLRGRVVDGLGQPVGTASISLLTPDGRAAMPFPEYRNVTNADGRFAFDRLPEGGYVVVAEMKGLAPAAASAMGGDDVELTLVPGVSVAFVKCEGGRPFLDGCQIRIRDESGVPLVDASRPGTWMKMYAEKHEFQLAPGDYSVEILADTHQGEATRFTAGEGVVIPVEMVPLAESAGAR